MQAFCDEAALRQRPSAAQKAITSDPTEDEHLTVRCAWQGSQKVVIGDESRAARESEASWPRKDGAQLGWINVVATAKRQTVTAKSRCG